MQPDNKSPDDSRYEVVYTVSEFHDLPLEGIAAFGGRPHCYRAVDYPQVFKLWPIDEQALQLALEDWQIYVRWDQAMQAGLASDVDDDVPMALPADGQRHRELQDLLAVKLTEPQDGALEAVGIFRPLEPWQEGRGWVHWGVSWSASPRRS